MNAGVAVEQIAASRPSERYETLRSAALGGELALEARSGLALFLRRGMWAWTRAVAIPSTPLRPRCLVTSSTAQDEERTVIHLFAAMAMRSSQRRPHERIAQSPIAPPGA
jgi:hypothetical protein